MKDIDSYRRWLEWARAHKITCKRWVAKLDRVPYLDFSIGEESVAPDKTVIEFQLELQPEFQPKLPIPWDALRCLMAQTHSKGYRCSPCLLYAEGEGEYYYYDGEQTRHLVAESPISSDEKSIMLTNF